MLQVYCVKHSCFCPYPNTKKVFALILVILRTVTRWICLAMEETMEFQSGDYSYVLQYDGTAEITHYRGKASSPLITGKLDEYAIAGTIAGIG